MPPQSADLELGMKREVAVTSQVTHAELIRRIMLTILTCSISRIPASMVRRFKFCLLKIWSKY